MTCATLSVADIATSISNERAIVRVNVSAMDVSSATSKLRKKSPDEAQFPLPAIPYLPLLGRHPKLIEVMIKLRDKLETMLGALGER